MKSVMASILALVLLTSAEVGHCQETPTPAEAPSWYGYQILLADAFSYAIILGSLRSDTPAAAFAGLGTYGVLSPVVHGLQHQPNKVVMSLALRLLLPLVGYAIGEGNSGCGDSEGHGFCEITKGFLGMGIGMIAATAVDASLAWSAPPAPQPEAISSAASDAHKVISLASVGVVPAPNGARLVVAGQF